MHAIGKSLVAFVLDAINEKFGRGALMPAATGIKKREWEAKFDRREWRATLKLA
jgi:DNA polymerase V